MLLACPSSLRDQESVDLGFLPAGGKYWNARGPGMSACLLCLFGQKRVDLGFLLRCKWSARRSRSSATLPCLLCRFGQKRVDLGFLLRCNWSAQRPTSSATLPCLLVLLCLLLVSGGHQPVDLGFQVHLLLGPLAFEVLDVVKTRCQLLATMRPSATDFRASARPSRGAPWLGARPAGWLAPAQKEKIGVARRK